MGKGKNPFAASSEALDPTLSALFASSSGPVKAPPKSRYSAPIEVNPRPVPENQPSLDEEADEEDDEELSEASEELDYEDDEDRNDESESGKASGTDGSAGSGDDESEAGIHAEASIEDNQEVAELGQPKRDRKRKRRDEHEDLEDKYLAKLAEDDSPRPSEKRARPDAKAGAGAEDDDEDNYVPPLHETLTNETTAAKSEASELEKAARTVFLSNVSSEAISSKAEKKALMKHLSSILDSDASPPEKVESIRFRSVALSTGSMPKRAAVITRQLMGATTKSTNAYAVFSSPAAARKAVDKLNGTEVLGRHLRVDSVSHPTPVDHRRCVFVGNLGFVDDETVLTTNEEGETTQKKRNKTPSDIEEGLWRTFGKQGKVESVRVVRDPKTRVGKGFAYVQFYDANSVEAAVLLDGKKFPPMLPRALRVQRATHPRKTALAQERQKEKLRAAHGSSKSTKYTHKATPEEKSLAGRAAKLFGRSAVASRHRRGPFTSDAEGKSRQGDGAGGILGPENFVFEGKRASAKDGRPKELKMGKKGKGKASKLKGRGARRAAEWRKKPSL